MSALPHILEALLILIIGLIVAKIIRKVIVKLLTKAGVDKVFAIHEIKDLIAKYAPNASIAKIVGGIVYFLIVLAVLISALSVLDLPPLNHFIQQVFSYLPNLVVAIVILAVGIALSGAVGGAVHRAAGDTGTGKIVATVVPTVILVIAAFAALDQLKVASNIVHVAFTATSGGLALGFALAFGLGGAKTAEKLIEQAHEAATGAVAGVKQDVETVRSRGLSGVQAPSGGSASTRSSGSSSSSGSTGSSGSSPSSGSGGGRLYD
ncbi:MAG: hypothetical protein J2O48_09200 [Solirubrobacterales bacterium]|nr:hypothetical protein [Solirubrobacterales bacterium]